METGKAATRYLVADLFCGAGGSSTGAERAVKEFGGEMDLVCVNHWPIAMETHKKNHPAARHYIEDLATVDPERIVPEGRLDLLMASPECRFYSRARGGKPVHDQGRMNPWAIQRWLTSLDVRCVLIENVPEFVGWGPLNAEGKPDKSKKGVYFEAWVKSFWELGYAVEWKYLNAADFGDATTRTRFFLQARKDGSAIRWPERTHTPDGAIELFDRPARWRGAREIIDWANPGRSLLDDPKYINKPLSEKTRMRIARGLERFGGPLAPLYISLLGLESLAPKSLAHNSNGARPFIMGKQSNPAMRDVNEPIPTVTTDGATLLIQPTVQPFVLGQQSGGAPRSTENPVPTVTSDGAISLVQPIVTQYNGQSNGSSIDKPLPTQTGKARFGVVNPLVVPYGPRAEARSADEPLHTIMTKDRLGLASPILLEVNHGDDAKTGRREKPVDVPLGTLTTHRTTAIVNPTAEPFIVPQFGEAPGQSPRTHDVNEPLPSVTSHGAGALVRPLMVEPALIPVQDSEGDPRRLVLVDDKLYLLDIRFRMLTNEELAKAMGFTNDEARYEFVGNVGEVTKQIGNAVPVNTASALVTAILAPESAS